MAIPEYPGLMQPVLNALGEANRDTPFVPLMKKVASRLGITSEELAERLPSGNETVFANRLHWALAYLENSGAVEERRGHWRPARAGGKEAPAVSASRTQTRVVPPVAQPTRARETARDPDAVMAVNAGVIHEQLKHDLLQRIHVECPEFFERLILELLLAMGYGCRRDLARHLGRSGDGGIDGAVPQDVLGLDVIYIQAKRYHPTSSVPASAVREFAGSLNGRKARKGVFVTTATFPRSAATFVSAVPSKIVLIDGPALADLLIGYNIGVKVRGTYEVKQIDEAYMAAVLRHSIPF
jgi:restriction system protein